MNWSEILEAALAWPSPGPTELAAALAARGRLAKERGASHPRDESLRQRPAEVLQEAALLPGAKLLVRQIEEAGVAFEKADDELWQVAERSVAQVLQSLDQWELRAEGLQALGCQLVAEAVRSTRASTLQRIETEHATTLEMVDYLRDDELATAWDPARSAWRSVPPVVELDPARDARFGGGDPTDAELLEVAIGRASPLLANQVRRALGDAQLRKRYDDLLEVAAVMDASPILKVIPGARRATLSAARPKTVLAEQGRLAADTFRLGQRFEAPADADLEHTFADGAQLYVERFGDRLLVRLYRADGPAGADDGFGLRAVDETWVEGRVLCSLARPGLIDIRYRGERFSFELEPVK